MWKTIVSIIGAVVVLGSVAGGVLYMDDRHAHTKALTTLKTTTIKSITLAKDETKQTMQQIQTSIQQTNARITQHTLEDRINGITQQLWNIENRCDTTDVMAMPAGDRERYRRLVDERSRLELKLKRMTKDGD